MILKKKIIIIISLVSSHAHELHSMNSLSGQTHEDFLILEHVLYGHVASVQVGLVCVSLAGLGWAVTARF